MKKSIILSIFLFFGLPAAYSQETKDGLLWYNDIMQAQAKSAEVKKPIFAFFTGSDWCGWCHKLQREVFAKPDFKTWAKESVVLLELDYPRNKQLPPKIAQQNAELQQTFQVQGFPTVWMFYLTKDSVSNQFMISALGQMGYPRGATPGKEEQKFLGDANSMLKARPKP